MTAGERAAGLFCEGYNCCQAVAGAFAEALDADFDALMRLTSAMGGGVAGMRGICGAVTGMCLIYGLAKGDSAPMRGEAKTGHYASAKALADKFMAEFGSLQCAELLENANLAQAAKPDRPPEPRTQEYYASRPCPGLVKRAAELLEAELQLAKP